MSNDPTAQSVLAADVEITGAIKTATPIRIEGKLDGELHCSADAVIGKNAVIKGNLSVNSVVVEGTVQGNITAKDKIDMKATAKVNGDIASKRLAVEDGVTFVGRSEVNPSGSASAPAAPAEPKAQPEGKDEQGGKGGVFGRR